MTMLKRNLVIVFLLAGVAVLATGCGNQPTPDVNTAVQTALAQTREAEGQIAQAVAATLTANAPQDQPTTPPTAPATATSEAAPTSALAPTDTPTPVQVEISPPATPTAPPPPAPTPTPVRIAISPVDGNDGNDFVRSSVDDNNGRVVLLPGFDQDDRRGHTRFPRLH
jgi:hypothetical protein